MDKRCNNRQKQALETKKRIYDVTKMLIDTYGVEKLTIKRICREANISVGTFYYHYSSKDEVIYDMLIYINEKFLDEIENNLNGKTKLEMISDLIVRDMKFKRQYTQLYKDTLQKILLSKKSKYNFIFSYENKSYAFLQNMFASAKQSNELPADIGTDELCNIFQTILWGLTDIYRMDKDFDIVSKTGQFAHTLLYLANAKTASNISKHQKKKEV